MKKREKGRGEFNAFVWLEVQYCSQINVDCSHVWDRAGPESWTSRSWNNQAALAGCIWKSRRTLPQQKYVYFHSLFLPSSRQKHKNAFGCLHSSSTDGDIYFSEHRAPRLILCVLYAYDILFRSACFIHYALNSVLEPLILFLSDVKKVEDYIMQVRRMWHSNRIRNFFFMCVCVCV